METKEMKRIYAREYYRKNRSKLTAYMRSRAKLADDSSPYKMAGVKAAIIRLEKSNDDGIDIVERINWLKSELKRLEKLK